MTTTLAFDIGGTHLRAGVVDENGVVAQCKRTLVQRTPESVAKLMQECAAALPATTGDVGVGIAAMISQPSGKVENAPNLGWQNLDFATLASGFLDDRRILLLNDLDAICLGEARYGAAKGASHVLCIYVGTGVGAGLLLDGKPYSGARGVGGEFGHLKSSLADGMACGCGQLGCLEALVGGKNLLRHVATLLDQGKLIKASKRAGPDDVHLGHVDQAAREGDVDAICLWNNVSNALGDATANVVTLLNPQQIVFGGGVLERCPTLYEMTQTRLLARANPVALPGLQRNMGTLQDAAGLLGAAASVRI